MAQEFICTSTEPVVQTKEGKLRGFKLGSTYHFYGVKYAECKRWQQPLPVEPWDGIKDALSYGYITYPASPDSPNGDLMVPHRFWPKSEDCLNLNIWTQSIDKNAKKPVMVWMHGGGYASGSAIEMVAYDGRNMSEFGDIVFVSINHRLNILGFLDVSPYGEEYKNSANCGMADLVAALQWIHDNIEGFGGDPGNVTIFGQSGGGGKVSTLMQIPAADGLYHKVIVESGLRAVAERKVDASFSPAIIKAIMKHAGTDKFEDLLAMSPEELLKWVDVITPELAEQGISTRNWGPFVNDWFVGHALEDGFTEYGKTVPMMLGSNIAEFGFAAPANKYGYTEEEREEYVKAAFPDGGAEKLMELFRKAWPNKNIIDSIYVDDGYRPSTLEYMDLRVKSGCAPTYNYVFAFEFPYDGGKSAWHCSEIPFAFRNTDKVAICNKPGVSELLENQMSAAWVNFARTGNPNNEYLPVEWPEWKEGAGASMIFDEKCEVKVDFDRELSAYHKTLKFVPVVPKMNF